MVLTRELELSVISVPNSCCLDFYNGWCSDYSGLSLAQTLTVVFNQNRSCVHSVSKSAATERRVWKLYQTHSTSQVLSSNKGQHGRKTREVATSSHSTYLCVSRMYPSQGRGDHREREQGETQRRPPALQGLICEFPLILLRRPLRERLCCVSIVTQYFFHHAHDTGRLRTFVGWRDTMCHCGCVCVRRGAYTSHYHEMLNTGYLIQLLIVTDVLTNW